MPRSPIDVRLDGIEEHLEVGDLAGALVAFRHAVVMIELEPVLETGEQIARAAYLGETLIAPLDEQDECAEAREYLGRLDALLEVGDLIRALAHPMSQS